MGVNQALLAKFGWKIITQPSSLLAQVLKAKYFPLSTFTVAVQRPKLSPIWSSILWGRELLLSGLGWHLGEENAINICKGNWIPLF